MQFARNNEQSMSATSVCGIIKNDEQKKKKNNTVERGGGAGAHRMNEW